MPRSQLNCLPTFVAVARLENLLAAADALHLAHSAFSQEIGARWLYHGHRVSLEWQS